MPEFTQKDRKAQINPLNSSIKIKRENLRSSSHPSLNSSLSLLKHGNEADQLSSAENELAPPEEHADPLSNSFANMRLGYDLDRVKVHPNLRAMLSGNLPDFWPIQAKLAVSQPDDRYEQEADRVAEQVMNMSEPVSLQPQGVAEDEVLQTKLPTQSARSEGAESRPEPDQSMRQSKGHSAPLSDEVRSNVGGAFGIDFGSIRIHSDARADRMNRPESYDGQRPISFYTSAKLQANKEPLQGKLKAVAAPGLLRNTALPSSLVQTGSIARPATISLLPTQRGISLLPHNVAPVIQRRLMPLEQFKERKNSATKRKTVFPGIKMKRSTSDVTDLYHAYEKAVDAGRWEEASKCLDNLDEKIMRMRGKDYWIRPEARDQLLREMSNGVREERFWLNNERASRTGALQELGHPREGLIPIKNRQVVTLTMGQGLTANLGQVILFSGDFSSCSPIVMYNSNTRIGGLFHFPARQLDQQKGNLTNMYNRVGPTTVYLNDRTIDIGFKSPVGSDVEPLREFFENELGFPGEIALIKLKSNQYYVTLGEDGNVQIDSNFETSSVGLDITHDWTESQRLHIQDEWQNAPAATKFGRDDWNNQEGH